MRESRQDKLNRLMREHTQLRADRKPLVKAMEKAQREVAKINQKIGRVGQAIYDLKHNGTTPQVTDHAIVRYLERVEGLDIRELKVKVAASSRARRVDNVVVTVMPVEGGDE